MVDPKADSEATGLMNKELEKIRLERQAEAELLEKQRLAKAAEAEQQLAKTKRNQGTKAGGRMQVPLQGGQSKLSFLQFG